MTASGPSPSQCPGVAVQKQQGAVPRQGAAAGGLGSAHLPARQPQAHGTQKGRDRHLHLTSPTPTGGAGCCYSLLLTREKIFGFTKGQDPLAQCGCWSSALLPGPLGSALLQAWFQCPSASWTPKSPPGQLSWPGEDPPRGGWGGGHWACPCGLPGLIRLVPSRAPPPRPASVLGRSVWPWHGYFSLRTEVPDPLTWPGSPTWQSIS